jgi:ectoine hydroxylase-related dioxygenase (phytanoyl-CoA dioxygenase family)
MTTFRGRLRPSEEDDPHEPPRAADEVDRANLPPVVPRFRSRFGGLWTDLSNAHEILEGKRELGLVADDEAELLRHWIDRGFVILEGAVPGELIDEVLRDLELTLSGELPRRKAEWWTEHGKQLGVATAGVMDEDGAKLLDLHFTSDQTQQMIFHARIARFLALVFERPPLAFQSLTFTRGTRQPVHQDTAFVRVTSALEFAACWIALEDIVEGSGELEYYPGSHALPEELFEGKLKWVPEGATVVPNYSERLHERARRAGLELERFVPKKGDALLWTADLIHGGRADVKPGLTRRSLVTHYCPVDQAPMYFRKGTDREKVPSVNGGYVCEERWF